MPSHLLWPHRCSFQDVNYPEGHLTSVMSLPLLPSAPQKQNHRAAASANRKKLDLLWAAAKASSQHSSKQASEVRNQQGGSQRNQKGRRWMMGSRTTTEEYSISQRVLVRSRLHQLCHFCTADRWLVHLPPRKAAVPISHLQTSFRAGALPDAEAWHHEFTTAPHASPGQKSGNLLIFSQCMAKKDLLCFRVCLASDLGKKKPGRHWQVVRPWLMLATTSFFSNEKMETSNSLNAAVQTPVNKAMFHHSSSNLYSSL